MPFLGESALSPDCQAAAVGVSGSRSLTDGGSLPGRLPCAGESVLTSCSPVGGLNGGSSSATCRLSSSPGGIVSPSQLAASQSPSEPGWSIRNPRVLSVSVLTRRGLRVRHLTSRSPPGRPLLGLRPEDAARPEMFPEMFTGLPTEMFRPDLPGLFPGPSCTPLLRFLRASPPPEGGGCWRADAPGSAAC